MFTEVATPPSQFGTMMDEDPLIYRTEAERQQNPWTYLSGYDFAEEPKDGFDWLPGHA